MKTKITEQVSGPKRTIFGPEEDITGHMGHRACKSSYCCLGPNKLSKEQCSTMIIF